MKSDSSRPLIFLAFANDKQEPDRFLRSLTYEKNKIEESLQAAIDSGLCEVVIKTDARIKDILDVFQDQRYSGRIRIFHFSGHADGYQLLLESIRGDQSLAHGEGVVSFLKRRKELQLIFLNGCSTRKMASELVEEGVPAVIGTNQSISDEIASTLGARFYHGLSEGLSIAEAWKSAEDELKMKGYTSSGHQRSISRKKKSNRGTADFPWYMHIRKGEKGVQKWNLPDASDNPLFGLPLPPQKYYQSNKFPPEPYVGLKYFRKQDAAIFFGRGAQIRQLYNLITGINPIILFYGKSGVGKSSLLDAGLVPRIEDEFAVYYKRRVQESGLSGTLEEMLAECLKESGIDPDQQALHSDSDNDGISDLEILEKTVSKLKGPEVHLELSSLIDKLKKNQSISETDLPKILRIWRLIEQTKDKPLLLILDQVEEKFTRPMPDLSGQEDELSAFLKFIQPLFHQSSLGIRGKLILSFRKEYYTEIRDAFQQLSLPISEIFLQRLDRAGIIEAVTGISKGEYTKDHYHLKIAPHKEGSLAEIIADDLLEDKESPVAPVLQITLKKMWEEAKAACKDEQDWRQFSVDIYQKLKKEGTTMGEFFEQQMEKLALKYGTDHEIILSGLTYDILHLHTTEIGTAGSVRMWDLLNRYDQTGPNMRKLIQDLRDLSLLVQVSSPSKDHPEPDKANITLLAHDTLAPVAIRAYNDSDLPGQRAARILASKMRNVTYMLNSASFEYLESQQIPEHILGELSGIKDQGFKGFDRFVSVLAKNVETDDLDRYLTHILDSMNSDFVSLKEELMLNEADVQWVHAGKVGMRKLREEEEELLRYSAEMAEKRKRELADALAKAQTQLVSNYYSHALRAMEDKLLVKAAHYLAKSAEAGAGLGKEYTFRQQLGLQKMEYLDIYLTGMESMGALVNISEDKQLIITSSGDDYHKHSLRMRNLETGKQIDYKTEYYTGIIGKGDDQRVWSTYKHSYPYNSFKYLDEHQLLIKELEVDENLNFHREEHIIQMTKRSKWVMIETDKDLFYLGRLNRGNTKISSNSNWKGLHQYAFTSDGKYLITQRGEIQIWHAKTGKAFFSGFGLPGKVDNFSLHSTQPLIFITANETAQIWNYETGKAISENIRFLGENKEEFDTANARIQGIFLKNEPILVCWFLNQILFFNIQNREEQLEPIKLLQKIEGLTLVRDETFLISWTWDKTIYILNTKDPDNAIKLEHKLSIIKDVSLNKEQTLLFSLSKEYWGPSTPDTLIIWDFEAIIRGASLYEQKVIEIPLPLDVSDFWLTSGWATYIEHLNLGQLHVYGRSKDKNVYQVYEFQYMTSSGHLDRSSIEIKLLRETEFSHEAPIFNEDRSLLLIWNKQYIEVWKTNNAEKVGAHLHHYGDIDQAFFKGDHIISFTSKGDMYTWQLPEKQDAVMQIQTKSPFEGEGWGTDFKLVYGYDRIIIWKENEIKLWDSEKNEVRKSISLDFSIADVILRSDNSVFYAYTQDDYPPQTNVYAFNVIEGEAIGNLAFTGDFLDTIRYAGRNLVLSGLNQGKELFIWDLETGEQILTPIEPGDGIFNALFIHNGKGLLIFNTYESNMYMWDIYTAKPLGKPMKSERRLKTVFHAEGNLIVSQHEEFLYIWDRQTGKQFIDPIEVSMDIDGLVLSQDESLIACCGQIAGEENYGVKLWETSTGSAAAPAMIHGDYCSIQFSPDGLLLMSWDQYGIKLWHTIDGSPAGRPGSFTFEIRSSPEFTADSQKIIIFNHEENAFYEMAIGLDTASSPEKLPLSVEIATGTRLDDVGNVIPLSASQWQQKRDQLKLASP